MQDKVKKHSKRGGARAGAGRKCSDNPRNVKVSFSLTALAAEKLRQAADSNGCSRNDFIIQLLEGL